MLSILGTWMTLPLTFKQYSRSTAAFFLLSFLWGGEALLSQRARGAEILGWNSWRPEPNSNRGAVEELWNLYCISFWECLVFMKFPSTDCALPMWQWPSFRWQMLCCSTCVCIPWHCLLCCVSINISLIFYCFLSLVISWKRLVSLWWTCVSTRIRFFPGAVLLKWFCLWRLWLKSFPSSLQALSGCHVLGAVISSKGVKIKSPGGCGVKAACVHTMWNLKFFPSPLH